MTQDEHSSTHHMWFEVQKKTHFWWKFVFFGRRVNISICSFSFTMSDWHAVITHTETHTNTDIHIYSVINSGVKRCSIDYNQHEIISKNSSWWEENVKSAELKKKTKKNKNLKPSHSILHSKPAIFHTPFVPDSSEKLLQLTYFRISNWTDVVKLRLKWYSLHSHRVLSPNSHPKVSPFFTNNQN